MLLIEFYFAPAYPVSRRVLVHAASLILNAPLRLAALFFSQPFPLALTIPSWYDSSRTNVESSTNEVGAPRLAAAEVHWGRPESAPIIFYVRPAPRTATPYR